MHKYYLILHFLAVHSSTWKLRISIREELNSACLVSFRCLLTVSYSVESIPSVQSPQVLKSLTAEISTVQYWQIWPPDCEQTAAQSTIPTRSQSPSLLRHSTALYSPLIPVSTVQFFFYQMHP